MQPLLGPIHLVHRDPGCEGFGPSYLLTRPAGNLLLPRMGEHTTILGEYDAIAALGGLSHIFITDYHFGGASSERIAAHFGARVLASVIEQPKLKKKGLHTLCAFPYERQRLDADFEIIPVPGHTSGGVCLLWHDRKAAYLFTGDFLYFDGASWIPGSKTRARIESSLRLLATLDFDYLVGCATDGVATPYIRLTHQAEKDAFIQSVLAGFRK